MKTVLTRFVFACLLFSCFSPESRAQQVPGFSWVNDYEAYASVERAFPMNTNIMHVDDAGYVYTLGNVDGTVDFDPGPAGYNISSAPGSRSGFLVKTSPQGNLVWVKAIGENGMVEATSLTADTSGHLYVSGVFIGNPDVEHGAGVTTLQMQGVHDVFVLKFDTAGTLLRAQQFGGALSYAQVAYAAADKAGNVYITAGFNGTFDVDPGSGVTTVTNASQSVRDFFLVKLDASGNLDWVRTWTSSADKVALAVSVDPAGNVLLTGPYGGTLDLDPGSGVVAVNPVGNSDVFIIKMDGAGNLVWGKSFGGPNGEMATVILPDHSGNIYITGIFDNTADFDPGPGVYTLTTGSFDDNFVLKLSSEGEFTWARAWEISTCGTGFNLAVDMVDNVYMSGNYKDSVDADPEAGSFMMGTGVLNYTNTFVIRLNPSGNLVWAIQTDGPMHDQGDALVIAPDNSIYVTGVYSGLTDFDPGSGTHQIWPAINTNMYLLKLNQNGIIGMQEQQQANAIHVYPNPGAAIFQLTGNEVAEKISVFDIHGREVFSLQPQAANVSLDMQRFADGVYTVRVQRGHGVSAMRLILQR